MSDLLNSASLVMIPSGYKEDVVYSQIPTDGSGDLSFTRASNGTRINSAGLVEVCPWNIVQQSETFDNAIWNLYYGTITSNSQTAPNGTLTADTLTSSTQQYSGIYQSLGTLPTNVYTYSIYVKAGTNNFFGMLGQGTGSQIAIFNLSTGVVSSISNLDSASIENVGNGWYRCQIQKTGAGVEMLIFSSNIANSTPTASGTVFLWGAQTNIGATAKPYFPTTDRLNVPRLTYQNGGGGCPSLLLEKQSTNILTYSEDFSNAAWTKTDLTVIANAITSPDGTTNAQKIVPNTTNGTHYIDQFVTISSVDYTYTIYAKKGEYNYLYVNAYSNSSRRTWFDLNSGTVSLNTSPNIATIESVGNGWYRCTITNTSSGTTGAFQFGADPNNGTINANPSFSGDGTSGIYVWGAQIEASSYPTSYIPTTSASATRVADECSKTGISSLIGQTEGVLFVDFVFTAYDGSAKWIAFLGGGANYIGLYANSNTYIIGEVSNTTSQFSGAYSFSVGQRYKIAIAYKSNDFAYYINGAQISTASSGTVPTTSDFTFLYSTTNDRIGGKVYNQLCLFKTRLTNAELASLTTI
jgi:hypothetical protein